MKSKDKSWFRLIEFVYCTHYSISKNTPNFIILFSVSLSWVCFLGVTNLNILMTWWNFLHRILKFPSLPLFKFFFLVMKTMKVYLIFLGNRTLLIHFQTDLTQLVIGVKPLFWKCCSLVACYKVIHFLICVFWHEYVPWALMLPWEIFKNIFT